MAGTLVETPANKAADYTRFLFQMERLKKGFFNIEFTTLADGATPPAIKAGSWIETDGAIYKFEGDDEVITGWGGIANSTVCYVKVIPDGDDITAEFTDVAPTYIDLKNGWYDGDDRYILWLYKDAVPEYTAMVTEPEVTRKWKLTGELELPNASIDRVHLVPDIIDGTKIENDAVDSEHIAAGAVDLEHMAANSVNSPQYVDGSIDLAHMAANSVDSPQYVNGSIDREHLAADIIDGSKIANDAINSEHYAGLSIDTGHIANAQITTAKLKTSMSSVSVSVGPLAEDYTPSIPGGEYGFNVKCKASTAGRLKSGVSGPVNAGCTSPGGGYWTTGYLTPGMGFESFYGGGDTTGYAQVRYVTSSGEIHWIFILRDKDTKKIRFVWQAPDHPCFGNGGKPQLFPHPFGEYDDKYEIIVINPSKEEVKEIKNKCYVDDELEPDKDFIEVVMEDYDIDERSQIKWPTIPVTVGLPSNWENLPMGSNIQPIKKKIPKPDYIKVKKLKLKV